jgi:hypothetical protein
MRALKDILLKIATYMVLMVFFFSTTGFVLYKHICEHHEQHYSLLRFDDCCDTEPTEEVTGCCTEVNTCSTASESSNCCEEDPSYYKLSNWYIPNEKKENTTECLQQPIIVCEFSLEDRQETVKPTKAFTTKKKKPDPRKYRLFNRVKIDPPLI